MIKKIIGLFLAALFLFMTMSTTTANLNSLGLEDIDPLVDISVTVEIQQIRSLEKFDAQTHSFEIIDLTGDPDFYVKVFINDEEFISPIWQDTKYVYDPQWSATLNVPDEEENVNIKIQLWDWNRNGDKLPDDYEVEITYNIKTGHWWGDDYYTDEPSWADPSGYGRLNGCDDGSIYQLDRDCELLFDIFQNDYDNDGLPYWSEVEVYESDPEIANIGDPDGDGISILWEHKWGHQFGWHGQHYWIYDPFEWDDHAN